jgi:hypothetical protein
LYHFYYCAGVQEQPDSMVLVSLYCGRTNESNIELRGSCIKKPELSVTAMFEGCVKQIKKVKTTSVLCRWFAVLRVRCD